MASENTTVCILNNSPRRYNLGDPAEGSDLGFHPGATNLPRALFQKVQGGDDNQAKMLNALLAQGTLVAIDAKDPLSAAEINTLKGLELVRAASTHGDPETRARLAQRVWLLRKENSDDVPTGVGHLFESPIGHSTDASADDLKNGFKIWFELYRQQHTNNLQKIARKQESERREHEAKLSAVAAFAHASAAGKGK
jgi:hypothetical protein